MPQQKPHHAQDCPASTDSTSTNRPALFKQWMKRHLHMLISATVVLLMIGAGGAWYIWNTIQDKTLPEGFQAAGITVGGLEVNEAERLVHNQLEVWGNTPVAFVPDRTDETLEQLKDQPFTLKQLGISFQAQQADYVFQQWRDGGFWTKLHLQRELKNRKIEPDYDMNQERLVSALHDAYGALINRAPVDAQVSYENPLKPVYQKEQEGVELDPYQLMQQLEKAIQTRVFSTKTEIDAITLRMPLVTLPSQVTVEALAERKPDALLAEYTTKITDIGEGHYHNIEHSANVLNNWILTPGQSIRYENIAKQTADRYGLESAPIIEKGKFVQGLGGGLCQTSTTMYNAALLSGLEIVERHAHSLPVRYVPLGLDATYSHNGPDLIIRNDTDGDIVWKTSVTSEAVTIAIYGQHQPGVTYEMETRVVKEVEPETIYELKHVAKELQTQRVQSGKKGYVVETYRVKKKNGYIVAREKMRTSYYQSQPLKLTADADALPVYIENMP